MTRPARGTAVEDHQLLEAVAVEARASASSWFPELVGPVQTALIRRKDRPRCHLYRLEITDRRTRRFVVVKVRHSIPRLRRLDRFEHERPVVTPERTLADVEAAHREFVGLCTIGALFHAAEDSRFGVLRPLAWLPEHAAIVMDHINEPTLRDVYVSQSRLNWHPLFPRTDMRPWLHAGRWLRVYHGATVSLPLTERVGDRDRLTELLSDYKRFLTTHSPHARNAGRLADRAGEVAAAILPPKLPLVLGHGDYTMRNIFTSPTGRVTGFDPLPLWSMPCYEDLARFLAGVRLQDMQSLLQGLPFGPEQLDRYEEAFLLGYFGDAPAPATPLRVFQAILLLDKWGEMVSKQAQGSWHRQLARTGRARVSTRYFDREARRLLRLLSGPPTVERRGGRGSSSGWGDEP